MRYDVITGGYVSLDRIVKITSPARAGYTSIVGNADNAKVYYGGCPINIAYHLTRLGLRALPIVRVGRDYEESGFRDFLERGGVCTDAVERIDDDVTSNCYLVEDPQGRHITLFYPGAQDKRYFRPMRREFFENAGLAVLTVGSSADTLEFFQKCREAGVRLVFGMKADFDAFPEGLLAEVLRYSSVIFTNQTEREEIEKRLGMNSITELLGSANASVLVTTMGGRGSLYYEKRGGGIVSGETAASPCARVIDATGSGDAYISGFLYGLLKGCDTDSCCRLGSVLASFVIERMGCCEGAPDEGALLRRYRGEE